VKCCVGKFWKQTKCYFLIVLDFFLFELTDVSHLEDADAAAVDDDSAVCKLFVDV